MPPLRTFGASGSGGPSDRRSARSLPLRPSAAPLVVGLAALLSGTAGCQPPTGTADEVRAPRHVIPRARSVAPKRPDALEPSGTSGPEPGSPDGRSRADP